MVVTHGKYNTLITVGGDSKQAQDLALSGL